MRDNIVMACTCHAVSFSFRGGDSPGFEWGETTEMEGKEAEVKVVVELGIDGGMGGGMASMDQMPLCCLGY